MRDKTISKPSIDEIVAEIFLALKSPYRIRILKELSSSIELNSTEIQKRLGISQSSTSQHLTILKGKGLVRKRKEGNHSYYTLTHLGESVIRCIGRIEENL